MVAYKQLHEISQCNSEGAEILSAPIPCLCFKKNELAIS